jgi:hypothetical protein
MASSDKSKRPSCLFVVYLTTKPGAQHLSGKTTEDPRVDGRIILRWIFRKWDVGAWTGSIWLRIRTGDGHL